MKTTRISIGVSGLIGTILCLIADIGLKGEGSAIKVIRDNLAQFFGVGLNSLLIIALILVALFILIGVASCFVFGEPSNTKAFYRGASILAIVMTLVPNPEHPTAPTVPQSERVDVLVSTSDGRSIPNITLTVWNLSTKSVDSVTTFSAPSFSFYQDAGRFRLDFEARGYRVVRKVLVVENRVSVPQISITLQASGVPIFIQRVFPIK